jgi:hypothetical protein
MSDWDGGHAFVRDMGGNVARVALKAEEDVRPGGSGATPTLAEVLVAGADAGFGTITGLLGFNGVTELTSPPQVFMGDAIALSGGSDGVNPPASITVGVGNGAPGRISVMSDDSTGTLGQVLTAQGDSTAIWDDPAVNILTDPGVTRQDLTAYNLGDRISGPYVDDSRNSVFQCTVSGESADFFLPVIPGYTVDGTVHWYYLGQAEIDVPGTLANASTIALVNGNGAANASTTAQSRGDGAANANPTAYVNGDGAASANPNATVVTDGDTSASSTATVGGHGNASASSTATVGGHGNANASTTAFVGGNGTAIALPSAYVVGNGTATARILADVGGSGTATASINAGKNDIYPAMVIATSGDDHIPTVAITADVLTWNAAPLGTQAANVPASEEALYPTTAEYNALIAAMRASGLMAQVPASLAFGQQPTNAVVYVAPQNEIQRITGGGVISGGTWDITSAPYWGNPVNGIAWDIDAAGLSVILDYGGAAEITGGPLASAPFEIAFSTGQNVSELTVDATNLTGTDPTLTPSTVQEDHPELGIISPAVAVLVLDDLGNLCTRSTTPIAVELMIPGDAMLSGTRSQVPVGGVATFDGLAVDIAATYTLGAGDGILTPVESDPFTIS